MIGIRGVNSESITVLVNQQHGSTSKPFDGQIEIFIERKTQYSDSGGIQTNLKLNNDLQFEFITVLDRSSGSLQDLYKNLLRPKSADFKTKLLMGYTPKTNYGVSTIKFDSEEGR